MALTHILVDFENTQPKAADVALLRGTDERLWIFRGPGQKKYDAEFAEALMALGERVRVVRCEKSGRNALDMHIAFQVGRLVGELIESAQRDVAFVVVSRDTDYDPLLQYVRGQGFAARREISVAAALGAAASDKPAAKRAKTARGSAAAKASPAAPARTAAAPAAKAAKKAPAKAPAKAAKAKAVDGKGAGAATTGAAKGAKAAKKTRSATRQSVARGAAGAGRTADVRTEGEAAAASIDALADKAIERLRDHPRHRPTRRDRLESWLASHLRSKLSGEAGVDAVVAEIARRGLIAFDGNKVAYPQWP